MIFFLFNTLYNCKLLQGGHEEDLGFDISADYGTEGDGLYSPGYSPTQTAPPAYQPGYVQTEPIPPFPGQSSPQVPHPSLHDDPIARQAFLFTQAESGQTTVFGPGVQQTSEIEEVRQEPVQSKDVQADDSASSADTDETPLCRRGRGYRKKKARTVFSPEP